MRPCDCGHTIHEVFAPYYGWNMCPDCGAQSSSGREITGDDVAWVDSDED